MTTEQISRYQYLKEKDTLTVKEQEEFERLVLQRHWELED